MSRQPLSPYVRLAVTAARRAGALLATRMGKAASVTMKRSPIDLVTEMDRASERLIRRTLQRASPTFGFLGEEYGDRHLRSLYRWIVDPLDGTMNFVHGLPFFGVSIGLAYAGTPIVGVVYDPIADELFTASRGGGAFLNGERIAVSSRRRLAQSLLSTGFSSTFRERPTVYLRWFRAFESRSHAVRRLGSTALCLAYVAAGRFEGFYERDLWPWDVAAGMLLVQEAGGRVSDFNGRAVILEEGRVVASNGRIHREMLRVLGGRR